MKIRIVALIMVACFIFAHAVYGQPLEGDIHWKPPATGDDPATNYVQGPWAVQWQGNIYVGGHSGYFGEPWYRLRDERPWVIEYDSRGVVARDRVIDLLPDGHEFGFGSMVRVNGWWLYSAVYTRWDTLGQENRTHLMLAMTEDPMKVPYPYAWWELPPPAGGVMSALVWIDDRLLLFFGDAVYQVELFEAGIYQAPTIMRVLGSPPPLAWSDIALGNDGRLYALVSGNGVCWWFNCLSIDEYSTADGLNWIASGRHWSVGGLPGGIVPPVGDACYVRDELGHIDRDRLTVVAVVNLAGTGNPQNSAWYLHWWSDPGTALPGTWGHEPGWTKPRIRKVIPRGAPQTSIFDEYGQTMQTRKEQP